MRLGRPDLGHRVVVRHRLPDGRATDVLGELIGFTDTELVVRDRHDVDHHVGLAEIVAAKRIPPAPPRR